jgi:hypothetical protein
MFFWKRATEKEIEDFKQIVAHELFHCFQWWNLLEQHVNAHPDSKWWVEGSATYFSNVAYPQNDLEHWDFLLRLDNRSLDQTIFEMSYEDYLLFQYLANRIGDDGVLDLIKSLPISPGLDAQAAAMARQASIDEYFQEFTEAFLDNKILDTSGELITVLPHPNYGPALTLRAAENLLLEGPAFQLVRYTIEFEEEQGLIIKVDSDEASGTYNAREVDAVGSWGPMPEEVGCKGTSYLIAMTSIEPGSATNRLSLAAEPGEVTCSCVVGEWVLDLPSYQVVLQSTVPPENIIVESVAGSETLKFFQDGSMVGHWDALTSRNLIRTELAGEIHLLPHEIIMDGEVNGMYFITEATGEYFVEEEGEIHYVSSVSTLQAISIIDGVELEPVEVDQADALGSSQSYTCEGDLLTLFPPIGSGAGLLFKRSGP